MKTTTTLDIPALTKVNEDARDIITMTIEDEFLPCIADLLDWREASRERRNTAIMTEVIGLMWHAHRQITGEAHVNGDLIKEYGEIQIEFITALIDTEGDEKSIISATENHMHDWVTCITYEPVRDYAYYYGKTQGALCADHERLSAEYDPRFIEAYKLGDEHVEALNAEFNAKLDELLAIAQEQGDTHLKSGKDYGAFISETETTETETTNHEPRNEDTMTLKYQVILDNKVLSTHARRDLAEKALKRWMKKHTEERKAHNATIGWIDPQLVRNVSGFYHIKATY